MCNMKWDVESKEQNDHFTDKVVNGDDYVTALCLWIIQLNGSFEGGLHFIALNWNNCFK